MITYSNVEGKDRGDILLFALSTCVWCKKTRRLLEERGVAFRYVYVDLADPSERIDIEQELSRWNPRSSFPTLVIEGEVVVGFEPDLILSALGEMVEGMVE